MDFNNLSLFKMVKGRLAWLGQRQQVLAQNIANADTPGYKPKELKALKFNNVLQNQRKVNMTVTAPAHLAGRSTGTGPYGEQENRMPYETAPGGNAVVLEEQMGKINETVMSHRLTTEIYKKHLKMLRMSLGR